MPSSSPSCISRVQGPVQAILRPGQWCFGVRAIRQGIERWQVMGTVEDLVTQVVAAVEQFQQGNPEKGLANSRKVRVTKKRATAESGFVRIENYTQVSEWLDVLELHITTINPSDEPMLSVYAKSFSSGAFPTVLPCAPLLNIACCWFPFSDGGPANSLNKQRLEELRSKLSEHLSIELKKH
eukprot:gene3473-6104_t